jgi:hypothetical protein
MLTQVWSLVEPATIRHLETIGVAEGWKWLEIARASQNGLAIHIEPA